MPMAITKFEDRYRFLSNFYELPDGFVFRLNRYATSEHAYQAMKATSADGQEWVREAPSPGKAKKRGRQIDLRSDWEGVKIGIMEQILEEKFSIEELRRRLEATYPAVLVEGNDWGDDFWGVCGGTGKNWLGRLLMRVRWGGGDG